MHTNFLPSDASALFCFLVGSADAAGFPADQQKEISGHGGAAPPERSREAQQVRGREPGEPAAARLQRRASATPIAVETPKSRRQDPGRPQLPERR